VNDSYTTVIGLEVHVQLLTESKLFCGCSTRFGGASNTQTCPICTGMPGTLPVMNRRAFELALRTAVALNCQIAGYTKWDRKQYYYPDLPKGYQISQYDLPFSSDGHLEISDPKGRFEPKRIGIIRAHLEEDAGKSMHDEKSGEADSKIDLNRAGTPLLEIVSQPDMRSPLEAAAYLDELKLLLTYLGVSDCNMQEGSLRVDANVNLHVHQPDGHRIPTPIVEIKNMNSFRAVERALAHEAQRQFDVFQQTGQRLGQVPKQTRGWDDVANITRAQRHKEESSDYRYFPDPDLVPVTVSEAQIQAVRDELGELPADLRHRLELTYSLTPYDSDVIVNKGRALVDYYLEVAERCGDGKLAANWVTQDVLRELKERKLAMEEFPLRPADLADLLQKVKAGDLDTTRGREVFMAMLDSGKSADAIMADLGIEKVDETALIELCNDVVVSNRKLIDDIRGGKPQAAGAFVGHAKKKNPNVNPARVREICVQETYTFIATWYGDAERPAGMPVPWCRYLIVASGAAAEGAGVASILAITEDAFPPMEKVKVHSGGANAAIAAAIGHVHQRHGGLKKQIDPPRSVGET
jgi:aspartyl-tRNA(Asn)/glutamyl-tRNA(Gln) amidotransferase subunit B